MKSFDSFSVQDDAISQPQPVYGDDVGLLVAPPPPKVPRRQPPQLQPVTRVAVDYTFDELFGKAEVTYNFPVGRLIVLENFYVLPAERLTVGMRFRMEDGEIATVTRVDPPETWQPPSNVPVADGLYKRRIIGKVKRTGYVVLDVMIAGQTITTTPGHLFWSVTEHGWVPAGLLRPGELLENPEGGTITVEAVSRPRNGFVELYNIEVEQFHNYYVGNGDRAVLVHNGVPGAGGAGCGVPLPGDAGDVQGLANAAKNAGRVRISIPGDDLTSLDMLRIRLKYDQANRLLRTGQEAAEVGTGLRYKQYRSRRFIRDSLYPAKPVRGITSPHWEGTMWEVDEYVSRLVGGRHVQGNQHFMPSYLNEMLGPIEQAAFARLKPGTRITGFDLEFR